MSAKNWLSGRSGRVWDGMEDDVISPDTVLIYWFKILKFSPEFQFCPNTSFEIMFELLMLLFIKLPKRFVHMTDSKTCHAMSCDERKTCHMI